MQAPSMRHYTICGLAELDTHCRGGVTHVLSLLDPEHPDPPGLAEFVPARRAVVHMHDEIDPGPGIVVPQADHVRSILGFGEALSTSASWHLLIHCHMGISRSTAAMAMLFAQLDRERHEDVVFADVRSLRPQAWPNVRMIEIADELTGRGGRLVAALGRHYALQLGRRPELEKFMRENGRGREIDLASRSSIG
jgi:predicted protein tyrosine phosphatase